MTFTVPRDVTMGTFEIQGGTTGDWTWQPAETPPPPPRPPIDEAAEAMRRWIEATERAEEQRRQRLREQIARTDNAPPGPVDFNDT